MDDLKAVFEAALAKDPYDKASRNAFSDWLEDRGEDDRAKLHRDWTPDAQRAAEDWLMSFCSRHQVGYEDERNITEGEVIQAGWDYLLHGEYFTQQNGESLRDEMYSDYAREEFWRHWQTLTNEPVSEDKASGTVFSCSC